MIEIAGIFAIAIALCFCIAFLIARLQIDEALDHLTITDGDIRTAQLLESLGPQCPGDRSGVEGSHANAKSTEA